MSTTAPPSAETQYQPLSSLAVVGLAFGLASPLVFFIDAWWALFLLPLPALALSTLARRRIARSNGALAGQTAATFGVALSVICGLGWVTHFMTRDWILEHESRQVVLGWIEKLRNGQDGQAFLDCVEPSRRRIDFEPEPRNLKLHFPPPEGGTAPLYDTYRYSHFVSTVLRYGAKVEFTPMGRPEYKRVLGLTEREDQLKYRFRCTCPLGAGTATVTVVSANVPVASGVRRDWYIQNQEIALDSPNEYNLRLDEATRSANVAVDYMAHLIAEGEKAKAEKLFAEARSLGDFSQLYNVIRGGAATTGKVNFTTRKPMLVLQDQGADRRWNLTLRGQFQSDTREVEFEMGLATDDLVRELQGWRFLSCRFLGERRRTTGQVGVPKAELSPIPESFRVR